MRDRREEASLLAEDILENIELQKVKLSAVMLQCARLARLLGDQGAKQMFLYEAAGYPSSANGVSPEVFELARAAGRVSEKKKGETTSEVANLSSIERAEETIKALQNALVAARDPDISLSSSNPTQFVHAPTGNSVERTNRTQGIAKHAELLASSRGLAYDYATRVLFELEFSETASDIFDRSRGRIDRYVLEYVGQDIQKTESIQRNLNSENPEDWANAVHSCRRLLQSVADTIFPARDSINKNGKTIKLGEGNYINRLMAFIEEKSDSSNFTSVVGSSLHFIGERLDAIFNAAQKGSHATISSRDEAERYVVYTYLTVGDILSLLD